MKDVQVVMSYPIISVTSVINNSYEYNFGKGKEECCCAVCRDEWSRSGPREFWVECITCKDWTHERCTSGEELSHYVCNKCHE